VTERETLELYEKTGALMHGHFRLTSGLHSDIYLQSALVLQYPEHAAALGAALAAPFREADVATVLAPAIGGILVAHEVARALGVRCLFTERENGVMTLRRGFTLSAGEHCLVVEDVITTGGSTREVVECVEGAGGIVVGVGGQARGAGHRAGQDMDARGVPPLPDGQPRRQAGEPDLAQTPDVTERAVLEEDDGEPGELAAHEHRETLDPPRPHVGPVLDDGPDQRDRREQRAVVGREQAVANEEPAGETPEDPRAEPGGDDGDEDRSARAGPAEEARGGGGDHAEKQERRDGRERPAHHAPCRYSGRQRRSRRSTCLIPSAITMPITPSVRRATIMSAAFNVPSDWMMR